MGVNLLLKTDKKDISEKPLKNVSKKQKEKNCWKTVPQQLCNSSTFYGNKLLRKVQNNANSKNYCAAIFNTSSTNLILIC